MVLCGQQKGCKLLGKEINKTKVLIVSQQLCCYFSKYFCVAVK